MRHSEREEYERMRDTIADRAHELDHEISYGKMTLEEKDRILTNEFGPDWIGSLRALNEQIHNTPRDPFVVPHAKEAAIIVAALAFIGIIASLVYPGLTGAVIAQNDELALDIELQQGIPTRLPLAVAAEFDAVYAVYGGDDVFSLQITSADGTRTLLTGDAETMVCSGCKEAMQPPYLLELQSGNGILVVQSIAFSHIPN